MKASELISQLTRQIEATGDAEVLFIDERELCIVTEVTWDEELEAHLLEHVIYS